MEHPSVAHINIVKVRVNNIQETDDILAVEEPLEISISILRFLPSLAKIFPSL